MQNEPSKETRKRRGGIAVIAIAAAIFVVIFAGYNIWYVTEDAAEEPAPAAAP
ncbi:hypothetical protein QCN27_05055 [Cereibacter sp. SYSU M97828]|nr:hypothetical protein [Cereibacter flavus]